LWGEVVNSSRSLARQALVLINSEPTATGKDELARQIVRNQIAYVHVLRTVLRNQGLPPEAERYLTTSSMTQLATSSNSANAILLDTGQLVTLAHQRGLTGELSRLSLENTFTALSNSKGGLERIKKTPLPVQYRFLPRFFSRTFCLILPFAVVADLGWATPVGSGLVGLMFLMAVQIGDQLASPFADNVFDVPMTAITRTIEIDLLEMIGEVTPQPVRPVAEVLY
jgi:putative membrane protein